MTPEHDERLITGVERLASAWESLACTAQLFYDGAYPKEEPAPDAQVFFPGEKKPEPGSREEYDRLAPDSPGRFERLIEAARRENSRS